MKKYVPALRVPQRAVERRHRLSRCYAEARLSTSSTTRSPSRLKALPLCVSDLINRWQADVGPLSCASRYADRRSSSRSSNAELHIVRRVAADLEHYPLLRSSRRRNEEIKVIKLFGATDWFRAPAVHAGRAYHGRESAVPLICVFPDPGQVHRAAVDPAAPVQPHPPMRRCLRSGSRLAAAVPAWSGLVLGVAGLRAS